MNFPKTLLFLTVFNLAVATEFIYAAPTAAAVKPAPAPMVSTSRPTTATEEDIRDIRGPISIPYAWLWVAYVGGGAALVAAAYGGWRWYRHHTKERAKLPHELAIERLDKARRLMTTERAREYSFEVSEITRQYIESRFHERASRRTTEEFLHDLLTQSGTPLAVYHERLQDFLRYCDLAKFARWRLSIPDMEEMHASTRAFVLETRPQPHAATVLAPDHNGQARHRQELQTSH